MSGLAAVFGFAEPPSADVVRRMLRVAPHRGAAQQVEVAGRCAIGISGTEEESALAHLSRDGQWVAAVVGNLDNNAVLAPELSSRWSGPDAPNPASTTIAAFRTWGAAAVNRFRGAFAGVVWNGEDLWSFRDQVGFQPLFYRLDPRGFYVAGEAKQVAAGAQLALEPDPEALEAIFYDGISEDTAIKGVRRFLSSALARVDRRGRLELTRYWNPAALLESARLTLPEAREQLVALFDQAVGRVVTGRDAVTLSGGIDSPTVAAFAAPVHRRMGNRSLQAINTSYPDHPSVEEGMYARQVAEYLEIPLTTHVLTGTPLTDVDLWTRLADGPWDTLPMAIAAQTYRLAHDLGARTVLTGEMAEYVFTIRPSLLAHLLLHGRWKPLVSHLGALAAQGQSWPSLARRLLREALPARLGDLYVRLANRRSAHYPGWIDVTAVGGTPYRRDFAGSPRQRWRRAQLLAIQGTTSTLEADEICATVCGIRVRRPLADVDLWEFFLSLPAEVKFPDPRPKSIVRQAMRGRLPDAILDRRTKTIFDEYALGTADFEALRRWIDPSAFQVRGVNYDRLSVLLDGRGMTVTDLLWAYDLAKVHAFVAGTERIREDTSFGVWTGAEPGW